MVAAETADYWVKQIEKIGRFKNNKGKPAPYKPLLLLWMIGRIAEGLPARVTFQDAEKDLRKLMASYRLGKTAPKIEYPFVYLGSSSRLWQVNDSQGNDVTKMPQNIKESLTCLRERKVIGELTPEFELALHDPHIRSQVVTTLLNMTFPETTHEEILEDVKLDHLVTPAPPKRDPHFKPTVLLAYENRCSFCGFGSSLEGKPLGIDAAHVRMRARQGPDSIENGVALCVLHHRLFDRGALGLDNSLHILVSQNIMLRENESPVPIKQLVGKQMRHPQPGYEAPALRFVRWHREYLFRGPARHPA